MVKRLKVHKVLRYGFSVTGENGEQGRGKTPPLR